MRLPKGLLTAQVCLFVLSCFREQTCITKSTERFKVPLFGLGFLVCPVFAQHAYMRVRVGAILAFQSSG